MPPLCRDCGRTFSTELELDFHRETCSENQLFCEACGSRFAESAATEDGWHYRCPEPDCDGEGVGENLHAVEDVRVTPPS